MNWVERIVVMVLLPAGLLVGCGASVLLRQHSTVASTHAGAPAGAAGDFLDTVARDTWAYLHSDWATANHLPWSWQSPTTEDGDYDNPAEIGLYALSWLVAYDVGRPWSPSWPDTQAEVGAILDRLRAWQTGSQEEQPYGPNAFDNCVFYQWYWITRDPPVVGAGGDNYDNKVVPSMDNAWLSASLITIREYSEAHGHTTLAQKADAILTDMDFSLWYHPDTHRFSLGDIEDPQGGAEADYYSNENRIINFIARALGQLSADEFALSLEALEAPPGTFGGITVDRMAWDGSYFTYTAPGLFIREIGTAYGADTITPATLAQIAYAQDQGYDVWGLSDCFDVALGDYLQQGALPVATSDPHEWHLGLVTPHASALALVTPLASEAISNLQAISSTFSCAYSPTYGFRDAVMANPSDPDYGQCSNRFSALAQEWVFLSIVVHDTDFVSRYFYRDLGVLRAHVEMYGEAKGYLPLVVKNF